MSRITHEQMREHFKGTFNINDVKYEDIRLITNYIIQQEKQEKLLELYRKYFNVTEHWYETNNSGNIKKETAIEIEKLESELEDE